MTAADRALDPEVPWYWIVALTIAALSLVCGIIACICIDKHMKRKLLEYLNAHDDLISLPSDDGSVTPLDVKRKRKQSHEAIIRTKPSGMCPMPERIIYNPHVEPIKSYDAEPSTSKGAYGQTRAGSTFEGGISNRAFEPTTPMRSKDFGSYEPQPSTSRELKHRTTEVHLAIGRVDSNPQEPYMKTDFGSVKKPKLAPLEHRPQLPNEKKFEPLAASTLASVTVNNDAMISKTSKSVTSMHDVVEGSLPAVSTEPVPVVLSVPSLDSQTSKESSSNDGVEHPATRMENAQGKETQKENAQGKETRNMENAQGKETQKENAQETLGGGEVNKVDNVEKEKKMSESDAMSMDDYTDFSDSDAESEDALRRNGLFI